MTTSTDDQGRAASQATDDNRTAPRADGPDRPLPPSPEELQRLVVMHLGGRPERRRRPPWMLRLISAVLAVLALLLIFALLPELGGSAR